MSRYKLFEKNLHKLKFLEKKYPIDSLNFNGINIFPLVRLILHSNVTRNNYIKRKEFYYNKIKSKFITLFKLPKFYIEKLKFNLSLKQLMSKKIELLFFSDHLFYYDNIKGKKINLFIDPYYEALKKKYKMLKVEIVSNNFKKSFKKRNEPFYLKLFYLDIFEYLKRSFNNIIGTRKYYKINTLNKKFLNTALGAAEINKMTEKLDQIIFDSEKIKIFLKKINPKAVFLTCYYSYSNLAVILACKNLKIPTIDIQHGGHELYHLMYSNWKNVPNNGFALLPDYFWIWGKNQKNEGIFNNDNSKHKYIVGGKTQVDFWKKNKNIIDEKMSGAQKKIFIKKIKKYKKIILFSATYTQIPNIIFLLIKKSPKNWLWLIRAHPRHSNINEINDQFSNKKILNVEIYFPTKANLNFLLNNITHLIVEFSSVIYDALYFNVPSIVLHKKPHHFKKNIENKNLKFSLNQVEILKFIKKKTTTINRDKIVTDPKYARYAVKKIIQK